MYEFKPGFTWRMAEKKFIVSACEHHAWNLTLTAKAIGMSRATIYRKIEEYGIYLNPTAGRAERSDRFGGLQRSEALPVTIDEES